MLSRAAQRRRALRQLHRSYEQLSLPWLCPALQRFQSNSSRPLGKVALLPQNSQQNSLTPLQSIRTLATATDYDPHGSYIPFERSSAYPSENPASPSPWTRSASLPAGPPEVDASSLIILKDFLGTKPKPLRRFKSIGGDANEMHANLDVSLSVGMFERAALLVRRLAVAYGRDPPELLELHNKYLRALVSNMILNRRSNLAAVASKWVEVDMKMAGVEPDATTYALMLKMALRMLHSAKRERTVYRYWDLAKDAGMEEEVLGLPILSESDLGLLSEICSSDLQGAALGDFEPEPELLDEVAAGEIPKTAMGSHDSALRATQQKGLGLTALKDTLSLFDSTSSIPYPTEMNGTQAQKDAAYAQMRQRRLEEDCVASAMERWRKESEELASKSTSAPVSKKSMGALLHDWHQALVAEIDNELVLAAESETKERKQSEDQDRLEYAPYLKLVGSEKLAALVILASLSAISKNGLDKGVRLAALVMYLGKAVEEEFIAEHVRQSVATSVDPKRRSKIIAEIYKKKNTRKGTMRWQKLVESTGVKDSITEWSPVTNARVGAILTTMLFSATKVPMAAGPADAENLVTELAPAFRRVYQLEKGHRIGYVHVNGYVIERLRRAPATDLLAKHLPMVCEPRPWTGPRSGGFLDHPVGAMRIKSGDRSQLDYVEEAAKRGDLDTIFAGLTVLGKTGWKINKPVFDVMLEAWNSGAQVANISPEDPNIKIPEKPENDDPIAYNEYRKQKRHAENTISGYHSQRCFQNFQLEIARAYLGETFYLPHNLDFRGRAYPLPPYFNQMGADNCRGLLVFNEGRALGESGLRWLKIHLANLFGFDKASFQEREQWTMDRIEDIKDSANMGLKGRRWWLQAEDPFQCLAACVELTNALNCDDPTSFVSHLPIHQDGSCNGLQHYAALGGDIIGAQQVNLEPSDRPSDIYSGVAEHVRAAVAQDAENGDETAKVLLGKVTRKVVKQTVMTNVYGVTFLGAIRQVRRQLLDHYPEMFTNGTVGPCSIYIARKIFDALSSMFTGAHNIQFWLGDCANRITQSLSPEQIDEIAAEAAVPAITRTKVAKRRAKADQDPTSKFRSTVVWTTPLKLPVVQPYRKTKARRVVTSLQALSIREPHASDTVSKRKQLQAFPPNFIHSLDATHMLLSAIKCNELGLTFSAVHDSFWTHAADIDTMNRVLRDAFVRMHSDDIVGKLAAEFRARYSSHLYLAKLQSGSKVARKINAFRKARGGKSSTRKLNELLEEHKRMKLLNSSNEAEREEGRKMVTAGSIFAECQDAESSFEATTSLGVAGMGHVPTENTTTQGQASADDPLDELEEPTSSDDIYSADVNELNRKLEEETAEEAGEEEPKVSKAKKDSRVWVWLPLTFGKVPKKGEFDVSRLKDSQYFFS